MSKARGEPRAPPPTQVEASGGRSGLSILGRNYGEKPQVMVASIFRPGPCAEGWLGGARGRLGGTAFARFVLGGNDPAVRAHGKKAVPAGGAPIRGKMQQAEQPGEGSAPVVPRNPLQIHVPAERTMREAHIPNSYGPGVEARVTVPASPRTKQRKPNQVVLDALPAGTTWAVALAGGTNHFSSPQGGDS